MQSANLKEKVGSGIFDAKNALQSKDAVKRIFAYVESYEDIPFWRTVLHGYQTATIKFEIITPTKKGKEQALAMRHQLVNYNAGPSLIICIDSDYDFLLQGCTAQSKLINESNFIFQTYSYSIENLQCYSPSLHLICVQAANHDKELIDFDELLKVYSGIIYKLLVWNVYFRMIDDHTVFTVSDFCTIIKLTGKVDVTDKCSAAMTGLQKRVVAKLSALEIAYPLASEEIKRITNDLKKSEINESNAYLFVHGHTLKEHVVLKVLEHACVLMINEKYNEIKNNSVHATQMQDEMNHYENQKQPVSSVLNANTEFKNCFLYKKIKTDLDKYVSTFSKSV